jgi:cupin superfamily acireductone dioxygenase involved in methionine salvage
MMGNISAAIKSTQIEVTDAPLKAATPSDFGEKTDFISWRKDNVQNISNGYGMIWIDVHTVPVDSCNIQKLNASYACQ